MGNNSGSFTQQELLQMFYGTMDYFVHDKRGRLPLEEYERIDVYLPQDIDKIIEESCDNQPADDGGRCAFGVQKADSFTAARKLAGQAQLFSGDCKGEVLVLNFANPYNPGGGVRIGALAQEEDLCRKSSLLLSLESDAAREYYNYNSEFKSYIGTDAMMITPKVEIIKDENGNLLDESVTVAVITCAAPYVKQGLCGLSQQEYEAVLYGRILRMLLVAAHLKYKVLVLGAWGCGAFGNDAALISDLFYKALKNIEYNGKSVNSLFTRIEFAVIGRSRDSQNYNQFLRNFADFYGDEHSGAEDSSASIRGCLLGGAIGDALGYPVEFLDENQIASRFGEQGITAYALNPQTGKALISDDTQMSLFTANGILVRDTAAAAQGDKNPPRNYVAKAYLDWLYTQEHPYNTDSINNPERISWLADVPELYSLRAPGNTCLSALRDIRRQGTSADYFQLRRNASKGCGGVMRVAPIGCNYNGADIKQIDVEAAQLAAITHNHSLGYLPAAVLAHIVHRAVFSRGNDSLKDVVLDASRTVCEIFRDDENTPVLKHFIDHAVALSENGDSDVNNIHRLGEGWVAEETLAIAIYCALKYSKDFSAAVIAAVNHKGDSDSTGAVTGNILGAWLGVDNIDDKWKKNLELYDVILELADDLCRGCRLNESGSPDNEWAEKYIDMRRYED